MRVGIFSNAYKPEISGVIKSVNTFKDELERQGHRVFIFAPEVPGYMEEDYDIFRYPGLKLPESVNFPLAIPVSPYIDWLVPRLRLDVIHSQHPILLGEEGINFAKKLNLPHVFTHHTQYKQYSHYVPFNQNVVKALTGEVVRSFMKRSVKIIAPSESLKNELAIDYPELINRVTVMPTPLELSRFAPDKLNPVPIRRKYGLRDKFVFVSVGRLTPEKSFDRLIKAFARAAAGHPEARLLIVGDGISRDDLRKLAEKEGVGEQVVFTGFVNYDDVPSILAAADAFAFASTSETQGIVVIEAMAVKLPVVVVDAPGSRDVTRNEVNGLLTENTIDALAEGMRQVMLNADLRETLADNALLTAQEYSTEAVTRRLVGIYQSAIDTFARNPIDYKRFSPSDESRTFPPKWLKEMTGDTDWLNMKWLEDMFKI